MCDIVQKKRIVFHREFVNHVEIGFYKRAAIGTLFAI